ncbi:MAG: hypothetical protein H7144_04945 [Burkholderiales bacterium]|nr:hypothetical protein [Phycisphaerae bacterium]
MAEENGLTAQLNAMQAETDRLESDRRSKALIEYRDVVTGKVKLSPDKITSLLSRVGLTISDMKTDADIWADHQRIEASIVRGAALAKIEQASQASVQLFEESKTKLIDIERAMLTDTGEQMQTTRLNDAATRRMGEIEAQNPRIFV